MRVNVRQNEILKLGKQIIESAFPRKDVVLMLDMNLQLGVKIPALLEMGGTSLRISVFDRDLRLETRSFMIEITGDAVTNASIAESIERDRVTKIREEMCLYSDTVDITRFISNDVAKSSNRKAKFHIEKVVSIDRDGLTTGDEVVSPDLPQAVASQEVTEQLMRDMIVRGYDPATLITDFPIPNPESVVKMIGKNVKSEAQVNKIKQSFYRITGRPGVYRKGFYRSEFFPVKFTVSMPHARVSQTPQLFFHIEAINDSGISIDYLISRTDTNLILEDSNRYSLSSTLTIEGSSEVQYTREVQPPRTSFLNYFVPNRDFVVQSSGQLVGNPLLIRHVTSSANSIASSFNGIVKLRKPTFSPGSKTGANEIPFYLSREGDTLVVRLIRIPKGVVALGVQRRDASRNGSYEDITQQELCAQGSGLSFVDSSMRDRTRYEYRLKFIDKNSNTRFTSNSNSYYYRASSLLSPTVLTIADVKKLPASTNSGNVPLVNITVNVGTANSGVIGTLNAISTEGSTATNLISDQTSDSVNYAPIPAYYVKRMNTRTGLIETLGLFRDKLIIDDSALPDGRNRTIQPLSFFDEYRYIISLCMISPSSLSTTQTSTAIDPTSGRTYQFNAYKFKSRLNSADLPSTDEMSNIASKSIVQKNSDELVVGVESSVTVNFSDMMPRVTDLQVRKSYVRSNLLTWRVAGDPKLIDHFQVYADADGVRSFIGCAHAFTNNGTYKFDDRQMYDRVGRVNYYVKPVTLDFTRVEGDAYVSIVVSNTLPDHIMM